MSSLPLGLVLLIAALIAAWLAVDPRTPDLAAQVYRVGLFRQLGFAVWDEHWYAGHSLPGYSLLYPPLASLLGMRLLGALSVLASSLLFERLARSAYGEAARWGAAWFAVAALGDVWIGRLTFALGVSLRARCRARAAARALAVGGRAGGAVRGGKPGGGRAAGAGRPVGGARASARRVLLLALAVPVVAVVLPLALLFPEGGYEPYPILSFAATLLVVVAFLWALPAAARLLRIGAYVYLLACLACLTVHSPMGSNIERYAVLLAGPLLLCARLAGERQGRSAGGA